MKSVMTQKTIIGIDPDCDKSGIAIYEGNTIALQTCDFPSLLHLLTSVEAVVCIEAGWLITHNWHTKYGESANVSAKKGYAVGRNHETGRKIAEFCKYYGIPYHLIKPLRKCWQGNDKKITNEEFQKLLKFRGIEANKSRTNQEERDAGLIALTRL